MRGDALVLRPMEADDLPVLMVLERSSHLTPWTEGNFRDALAAGNLCLVGEQGGVLVACAVLQMAAGEAQLLTMAVQETMRREGLGGQMLSELIERATAYGAGAVWLEARVSNAAAIGLYHRAGFVDIGWRRNYYATQDGREDAIMMRLALPARRGGIR